MYEKLLRISPNIELTIQDVRVRTHEQCFQAYQATRRGICLGGISGAFFLTSFQVNEYQSVASQSLL